MIEELSGHPDEAARLYMEALQGNPAFSGRRFAPCEALRAAPPTAP
jgi:hypothetical protein